MFMLIASENHLGCLWVGCAPMGSRSCVCHPPQTRRPDGLTPAETPSQARYRNSAPVHITMIISWSNSVRQFGVHDLGAHIIPTPCQSCPWLRNQTQRRPSRALKLSRSTGPPLLSVLCIAFKMIQADDDSMDLDPNMCDYCYQRPKFPYVEAFSLT